MLAFSRFLLTSSIVSTSLATTFTVKVGAEGQTFTPNQVTAAAGDTVIFEFHPKNHTLTQSTLANPCTAVAGGGDSGFMFVDNTTTVFPTKQLIVPDATTPLWFYCKQTGHCANGMVFAINPGTQAKMDTFVANAKALATGGAASSTAATSAPAATTSTVNSDPAASTTSTAATETPSTGTGTPATGTTGSGTATGKTIPVMVGQGGLVFSPSSVTAAVGDEIVFTFVAGNHTVTQSTFPAPCTPMAGGQDSGFKNANGLTSGFPNFTMPVTDASKPLWFFCKQTGHCAKGMVFSVNAPTTGNTAAAFQAAAMASGGSASGSAAVSTPTVPAGGNGAGSRFASGASGLLVAGLIAGLLL